MFKTKRNSFSWDVLLSYDRNNLRKINFRSLWSSRHHDFEVVKFGKRFLRTRTSFITSIIQNTVNVIFKSWPKGVTRSGNQLIVVSHFDRFQYFGFWLSNLSLDFFVSLSVSNSVSDTDRVTFDQKPVVNDSLNIPEKTFCYFWSFFVKSNVNKGPSTSSQGLFTNNSTNMLSINYLNSRITNRNKFVRTAVLWIRMLRKGFDFWLRKSLFKPEVRRRVKNKLLIIFRSLPHKKCPKKIIVGRNQSWLKEWDFFRDP